jgi:hypothetical protein
MDETDVRPDDLPDLSQPITLRGATVQGYRERGHTLIRGLATPEEVAAYRPALLEAAPKGRYDHRPLEERDTYGKAFVQMFNLWTHDERARRFVFSERFARAAAELLGVDAVRLYHDQALFKEPGGGITPWHQDQFYWPLDTTRTITLWMPLVPVDEDMGPMQFASGSHALGPLGEHAIGDESEAAFAETVAQRGLDIANDGAMQPGDASFHAGWTLHRAGPNRSDRMREAMTIIYFADGTRVGPLENRARRFDRDVWLAGCEQGEPAAGPLNPVLYAKDATR